MNLHRALHQAAALLLDHPGPDWPDRLRTVAEALAPLPGEAPGLLLRFCRWAQGTSPLDLATGYVTTFDRSRRRTLHLTHYTDGDTRRRGATLAALKARYREHGWAPPPGELPDHLPCLLEFAARCPGPGTDLLHEHRPALALLAHGLETHHSPYADVVRAVLTTVPDTPPPNPRPAAVPEPRPLPLPFPLRHAPDDEGVRR
ncbi:nitrate reductase molybdenum cofactor assembly chaperone [Streptomyces sp. NPDC057197]|uniref:nitrate reductase molybdenum cofactor assembly chaperone n=1 Tax=unclassified Streptomyces TaxID=2593676 RepID=UPI0007DD125D|nr:nitrate reductase molybdenum cofactor assembly chaperone [Streptomyces sp. SAT1]ANH92537.1 nitrate reductase molybdenum cofactor assembly chaperone [Streptomyces sp. SAT1]